MAQAEATGRKTLVIGGMDSIGTRVACGVRVGGQRGDQGVEDVCCEGDGWRLVGGKEQRELEDCGCIGT
jgi:hypothetical protein